MINFALTDLATVGSNDSRALYAPENVVEISCVFVLVFEQMIQHLHKLIFLRYHRIHRIFSFIREELQIKTSCYLPVNTVQ